MMESKGRRAPRVARPTTAPAEQGEPLMSAPIAESPAEPLSEPSGPDHVSTATAKPAEIALDAASAVADAASSPRVAPPAPIAQRMTASEASHFSRDTLAALAQSQAALSRGLEALSAEMANLALSEIDSVRRTATQMLSAKTLSDAVAVNAGFTYSSLERLVGSSAKLSELSLRLATEAYQPILSQIGKGWMLASRSPS
jgi:hypothetical protein